MNKLPSCLLFCLASAASSNIFSAPAANSDTAEEFLVPEGLSIEPVDLTSMSYRRIPGIINKDQIIFNGHPFNDQTMITYDCAVLYDLAKGKYRLLSDHLAEPDHWYEAGTDLNTQLKQISSKDYQWVTSSSTIVFHLNDSGLMVGHYETLVDDKRQRLPGFRSPTSSWQALPKVKQHLNTWPVLVSSDSQRIVGFQSSELVSTLPSSERPANISNHPRLKRHNSPAVLIPAAPKTTEQSSPLVAWFKKGESYEAQEVFLSPTLLSKGYGATIGGWSKDLKYIALNLSLTKNACSDCKNYEFNSYAFLAIWDECTDSYQLSLAPSGQAYAFAVSEDGAEWTLFNRDSQQVQVYSNQNVLLRSLSKNDAGLSDMHFFKEYAISPYSMFVQSGQLSGVTYSMPGAWGSHGFLVPPGQSTFMTLEDFVGTHGLVTKGIPLNRVYHHDVPFNNVGFRIGYQLTTPTETIYYGSYSPYPGGYGYDTLVRYSLPH
jgi:hypothetical protein